MRTGTGWERVFPYDNGSIQSRLDLLEMRDRAIAAYENNPVAKSILNTEVTNVVADGYRLQAKAKTPDGTPDKNWNAEAQDRWPEFLENADARGVLDGTQIQTNPYRSMRRDGIGGFVLADRGGDLKLQHIPASKIVTPDGKMGDRSFANGVEVDASLSPVAYHILDLDEFGKRSFSRIPASNFVCLLPQLDDDLGVMAPSCYSTIFQLLDQLLGYVDGVAVAARLATVFGLLIKSDENPTDFKNLKTLLNSDGTSQRAITLENGMLKLLGSKSDVVQVNAQQPMQQTPAFITTLLRLIGMPFSMPLEIVGNNMSEANFATARVGILGYYRSCYARMKSYKSDWSQIYKKWIGMEKRRQQLGMSGAFRTPFPDQYLQHHFHSRAWAYTDPIRDPQSDQLQMDMGVKDDYSVCAERGTDHDEVQIQRAASMALKRTLGLPTDIRSTLTRDIITIRGTDPASVAGEDTGKVDKADGYEYGGESDTGGENAD